MRPNMNAALVAGGFAMGGLLGLGSTSARAQAVGGALPPAGSNYTQSSPYGDLGAGESSMPRRSATPVNARPTGTIAGASSGATRAAYPARSSTPATFPAAGMNADATRVSYPVSSTTPASTAAPAAAADPKPRAADNASWSVPPQKPKTGLAGFWDRMVHPGDYSSAPSRTIYVDPSTGRTDLPLSKPWLKGVTP